MSTFRKTVLTTAIIGAGLASTAGSAFATDCGHDGGHHGHGSHSKTVNSNNDSSCSNGVGTGNKTGNGGLIGIGNVADAPITANVCHILNDNLNNNLNGNSINVLSGLGGGLPVPGI